MVGKILTNDVGGKDTEWIETANVEEVAKQIVDKLVAKGLLKGVL